ncbi:MAG: glutaredoxin-like protein NrdH [Microbacteriaceae bacterium]
MNITVYTRPHCVQCTATFRTLEKLRIPFAVYDVSEDEQALAAVKELGYLAAPVVVTGEEHWSGFRPDKLAGLAPDAEEF